MRRVLSASAVIVTIAAMALGLAPTASAASDLSGKWNSASLRQGGPGYSMKVIAQDSPANAYDVVLRFHYQDGRVGPRIKAGMVSNGSKLFLVLNGKGSLEDVSTNPNIMKGTVGNDGSMYFPTCYKQLAYVTKKMAPEMCLFQELPV